MGTPRRGGFWPAGGTGSLPDNVAVEIKTLEEQGVERYILHIFSTNIARGGYF